MIAAVQRVGGGRRGIAALWVALAAVLGGCAAQPIAAPTRAAFVSEALQAQEDVYFVPGTGRLAPGEAARINRFLSRQGLRPEDDVIFHPGWTYSDALDRKRVASIQRAIAPVPARVRLAGRPGWGSITEQSDVGLVQVLRYDRLRVDCKYSGRTRGELLYLSELPPIGCANAINLAATAATLRDLTAPQALAPAGGRASAAAIERMREGAGAEPAPAAMVPLAIGG